MRQKDKHWCDSRHNKKDNHFTIGEMSEELYNNLEKYLLHDIDKRVFLDACSENGYKTELSADYLIKRMDSILKNAELLELTVKDANSVHGLYFTDFEYRRNLWLKARGLCFRLIAQCNHMANLTAKHSNIQKYVDQASLADTIQHKIYNIMKTDDSKKKNVGKPYVDDLNVGAGDKGSGVNFTYG